MGFRKDFIWGAATSAYQVEGAVDEDGKGISIWDRYNERIGKIRENIACDHYHMYKTDVKLMKEINLNAYRFSLNWTRIIPNGRGKVNAQGLDFYDRLVDELLENKIEPFITLFHWDYPNELFKSGHWLNNASSEWFEEYALIVGKKLGDRVKNWMTINEPQVFLGLGYQSGKIAPALKYDIRDIIAMTHNVLLSHGKAVKVLRDVCKQKVNIGYTPVGTVYIPASDKLEDIEVARKEMQKIEFTNDGDLSVWNNSLWLDPVFKGAYPEDVIKKYEKYLPNTFEEDLKTISQDLDFFGCNIYTGKTVKSDGNGNAVPCKKLNEVTSSIGWSVTPEAIYWASRFFYEEYRKPIIITENGVSLSDWISEEGNIKDYNRIDYIKRYLYQLKKAADDGIDIRGYFYWTLLDNLEWERGFKYRFGLIYVDYDTQTRYLKESAKWYKDVIKTNGENI